MPELPDVESFRRYSRKALDKKIEQVSIRQKKLIKVSNSTLRKHLLNKRFTGTSRHGKYLFLKISDGYNLVLHFGMTGELSYYKEEKPEHIALEIELANNYNFAVISVRKLGEIDITKSVKDFVEDKKLGQDALSISKKEFIRMIGQSKGAVKNTLMDQSKIAGIGNIYTDEILFQLGIHPKKKIEDMGRKEFEKLYKEMKKVLKKAVKHSGIREKMPKNYLIPKREALGRKKKGADRCPKCGGKLKHTTVGGRSTYYCSKHQKR